MPRKQRFKPSRKPKPIEQNPATTNEQAPVEQPASAGAMAAESNPAAGSSATSDS